MNEMSGEQTLQREMETFERLKQELVAEHEGKYALIHGDYVAGIWDTYEDALKNGYESFELKPFLVKKIEGIETVKFLSREVSPCQS